MADEQQTPDEEFDAAWNEPETDAEPSAEPAPEPADEPISDPEAEPETEPTPDAEPEPEAEPEPQPDPAEPEADVDWAERFRELEHKTKSWDGRLKARDREIAELREQLEAKADPEPDKPESTPPNDPDIAQLNEEYPDLVGPLWAAFERKMGEKLTPLQERAESLDRESHYGRIAQVHEDYAEVAQSDEFRDWINAQPGYLQPGLNAVVQGGSAEQVIELLTDYKQSREAQTAAQKADAQRQAQTQRRARQLNDAAAVRSRPGGVPRGRADPDDYDAAWDEAP